MKPKHVLFHRIITTSLFLALFALPSHTSLGAKKSKESEAAPASESSEDDSLQLIEGDVIEIYFPGAPELSGTQKVRRDGKITLAFVGEKEVTGLTSTGLEDKLLEWYDDQIVTKEVTVTLVSSSFPIYVQGMVLNPGEIINDRRITALEAVLKAGYNPKQANLKKVTVIRVENGRYMSHSLDLQAVLDGENVDPFFLQPSDIVKVPEKFIWTGRQ